VPFRRRDVLNLDKTARRCNRYIFFLTSLVGWLTLRRDSSSDWRVDRVSRSQLRFPPEVGSTDSAGYLLSLAWLVPRVRLVTEALSWGGSMKVRFTFSAAAFIAGGRTQGSQHHCHPPRSLPLCSATWKIAFLTGVLVGSAFCLADSTPATNLNQGKNNKPAEGNKATDTTCAATGGKTGHFENAQLVDTAANFVCITMKDCPKGPCSEKAEQVKVEDVGLRTDLKSFKLGDHLALDVSEKDGVQVLQSVGIATLKPPFSQITTVFVVIALALFAFATLVSWWHPFRLTIIGTDNRYSNSKFQMAAWFWVLIATYLTAVYFRVHDAGWDFVKVNIPQNLFLLSGLSALTYAGAKGITTAKVNEDKAKQATGATPVDPKRAGPPGSESFFNDLVRNDYGQFDFGDFQMIVVTLLAVGSYLTLAFHFVGALELRKVASLPDVDTTILAAFGLGQGAYLAKKAAGDVGKS
jgi:hypothetical protein